MSERQFTVTTKPAEKPQGEIVYRGEDLDRAVHAAAVAVRHPEIPRAVIYIDKRNDELGPDGRPTFAFTGESWGWAEVGASGIAAVHSVEEEAKAAARRTEDELFRHFRALLAHVRDVPHPGAPTLGSYIASGESALVNLDPSIGIEALTKAHRLAHPGEGDPYHDVKP